MVFAAKFHFGAIDGCDDGADMVVADFSHLTAVVVHGLVTTLLPIEESTDFSGSNLVVIEHSGNFTHNVPPFPSSLVSLVPSSSTLATLAAAIISMTSTIPSAVVPLSILSPLRTSPFPRTVHLSVASVQTEEVSPHWRDGGVAPIREGFNSDVLPHLDVCGSLGVASVGVVCQHSVEERVEHGQGVLTSSSKELVFVSNLQR